MPFDFTVETLTKQQMYDIAKAGIIQQGAFCLSSGACAYRNDKGQKCAVGFLIPDTIYDAGLEGFRVDELRGVAIDCTEDDIKFLMELQEAHDGPAAAFWLDLQISDGDQFLAWAGRMTAIAEKYGLVA